MNEQDEANAKYICKAVNNHEALLSALQKIYDESASLDKGVKSDSAADKQISRLWKIADEAIESIKNSK